MDLIDVYEQLEGWCKDDGARLFPLMFSNRTRGNRCRMKHKAVPPEHQESLFYCEDDGAWKQVAQGVCGVFIHGDIQKITGHSPGYPSLGDPSRSGWLDQMTSTHFQFKKLYLKTRM